MRYKLLSNEKHFDIAKFKEDLGGVPFSTVYGVGEPNQKLDIFNSLFKSCLDRHASLSRTKITRPPAPWLNEEEIRKLQREWNELRHLAHRINSTGIWEKFCDVRNRIRPKIKSVKRAFFKKALSSSKPKELWNIIPRTLNPSPQPIRADPDVLNEHFSSTCQRLLNSEANSESSLLEYINSLPNNTPSSFVLGPVTYSEVFKLLTTMRTDCSTGCDQIPSKYLKLSADIISSPLTHILNCFINTNTFPTVWKTAHVAPIPKVHFPTEFDHY